MTHEQFLKNMQVPQGKVDLILDTDAYNEIDDQFAISYALLAPEKINMLGICAAPFHNAKSSSPADGMEKSYNEIFKIVELCHEKKGGISDEYYTHITENIYKGSTTYLPDESTPVESDACDFIISQARKHNETSPLYVVAIGAITNVASALLKDPSIAEKIVIVWLGGNAIHWNSWAEFNMSQDIAAARVIFNSASPLVQLPCMGVVSEIRTTGPELEYWLKGKNPLADYLANNTINEAESYAHGTPWSRIIWDVTAIGWLLNDEYRIMSGELIHRPIPEYDKSFTLDESRPYMYYVAYINRDAIFNDLFKRLLKE